MIGIWKSYSDVYLIIVGVVTLLTFGLPLLFAPLSWARVFRWEIPQPRNLVIFLGRSLGVFISIVAISGDGKVLPPCGRCRELMYEIDESNLTSTNVILGEEKTVTLIELLPHPYHEV